MREIMAINWVCYFLGTPLFLIFNSLECMRWIKKYWKHIIAFSLPIQVLVVQWLASDPESLERWYTYGFYGWLSKTLRLMFGFMPFAFGQIVFYTLVFLATYWFLRQVWKRIRKKITWKKFLSSVALHGLFGVSLFYFLFMVFWGLNYHRPSIIKAVKLEVKKISPQELEQMCDRLIELTNASRDAVTEDTTKAIQFKMNHRQMREEAVKGYENFAKVFPQYQYEYWSVKSVFVPQLMSLFGNGGIYFPFTGEANVNMDMPDFLLPATICHEMAHQIGIASETEANYMAYMTTQYHPSPVFQYSGNVLAVRYAMSALSYTDSTAFKRLRKKLSPGFLHDLRANRKYWDQFQNPLEPLSRAFYDLFLKANSQREGIKSYGLMIHLIMGEFRKNGLRYEVEKDVKQE